MRCALERGRRWSALAYMNSHFQTGLKNVLDRAVLAHAENTYSRQDPSMPRSTRFPFDFQAGSCRWCGVRQRDKTASLAKASQPFFPVARALSSTRALSDGSLTTPSNSFNWIRAIIRRRLSRAGELRVRKSPTPAMSHWLHSYSKADESELILNRYVAFLDPPKKLPSRQSRLWRRVSHVKVIRAIMIWWQERFARKSASHRTRAAWNRGRGNE